MACESCNKGFSTNYMVLDPEEVGLFDLLHILFSSDIEQRKFVDSSKQKGIEFGQRWIIFISIVAQKFLLFIAKPLYWFGTAFEFFLNLVSHNTNFGVLLLNILTGKVVWPDTKSATFFSFCGHMDNRVELDSSIKHGHGSYYSAISMMAAKASYENKACIETIVTHHWNMEFLGSYDYWNDYQEKATTQAFLMYDRNEDHDQDTIVVSFRGTETFDSDAWCTDADLSWYEMDGMGKIHGGFMKALGLQKSIGWPKEIINNSRPFPFAYYAIRDMLKELLRKNKRAKFIITGHSLGGALAILFPAILILHEEKELLERMEGVYTFGQPRVGDDKFAKFMEKKLNEFDIKYFRHVYSNDIVPRLPFDNSELMFRHFGKCLYYNRHYEGKVLTEEPNKNYFSILYTIPMIWNAVMELIRSFVLPRANGPEYKEGWVLKLGRVTALMLPGVPVHFPQDYVNSTRLGPSDIFSHHKSL